MKQLILPAIINCAFLLAGCKADLDQIPQDELIRLEITSDTTNIKADGLRLIQLKATIPDKATEEFRNVTFQATPNSGLFQGSASGSTNIVRTDNQGIAYATFKVGTTAGTFFLAAQTGTGNKLFKTVDIPFVVRPISFADKLSISADNLQPLADNQTLVTIQVSSDFITEKTVKLTTNLGSFVASGSNQYPLPLDDNGNATTQLQVSNQTLPHIISAAFNDGTSAGITLHPQASKPDQIVAEPSSTKVDTAGAPTTIKVYLLKANANARVSVNTPVTYEAYQLIGANRKSVGRFTGLQTALSDATGAVPAVSFYADTKDFDGKEPVYIDIISTQSITLKFLIK